MWVPFPTPFHRIYSAQCPPKCINSTPFYPESYTHTFDPLTPLGNLRNWEGYLRNMETRFIFHSIEQSFHIPLIIGMWPEMPCPNPCSYNRSLYYLEVGKYNSRHSATSLWTHNVLLGEGWGESPQTLIWQLSGYFDEICLSHMQSWKCLTNEISQSTPLALLHQKATEFSYFVRRTKRVLSVKSLNPFYRTKIRHQLVWERINPEYKRAVRAWCMTILGTILLEIRM